MAIPSRGIDQIENGVRPKNAHANRTGKRTPRSRYQLTVKYAAIVGLSLEIVTACLDVVITRFHAASSLSWRLVLRQVYQRD
jgi:hypothetical protein